jgi:hypothetical protein
MSLKDGEYYARGIDDCNLREIVESEFEGKDSKRIYFTLKTFLGGDRGGDSGLCYLRECVCGLEKNHIMRNCVAKILKHYRGIPILRRIGMNGSNLEVA